VASANRLLPVGGFADDLNRRVVVKHAAEARRTRLWSSARRTVILSGTAYLRRLLRQRHAQPHQRAPLSRPKVLETAAH